MTDDKIEWIYERNELENFRKDILAGNLCDIFLPVSFIDADGKIGAVYDTKGYSRFSELEKTNASTLIGTVTSILEKSRQAERRYFFTGEYSLDPALLFVDPRIPDAALIYRKTSGRPKREVLEDLKLILGSGDRNSRSVIKGEEFIRKAMFILSDAGKSYDVILHDLMALGTEAFRAEC